MKRPIRHKLKVLAIGLAILVLAAGVYWWILQALNKRRFERTVASIRATGAPIRLADLLHSSDLPGENAAVHLLSARHDLSAILERLRDAKLEDLEESKPAVDGLGKASAGCRRGR